jgi:predicted phage terminase large subunit-like protein
MLTKLTGTSDPVQQLAAIEHDLQKMEHAYMEKLREGAYDSLSCYTEYMTPDEPPARHHEFMCDHLEAVERREPDVLRSTMSCPPGHAKTKFFSRMFPSWYLGRNPKDKFLAGGHSQSFAENELGKPVRALIQDERYQTVFPNVSLNPNWKAAGNWRLNNPRGGYVCKGVGQGIAGFRGNCGVIDDPFGSREDANSKIIRLKARNWLFSDFRLRLLPNSPLLIVATRWHMEDLIGVVEQMTKEGKGIPWKIINLTALIETEEEMANDPLGRGMNEPLWPDYFTLDELLELKATLPSSDWWALYKGHPRSPEGEVVKDSWFRRYKRLPVNGLGPDGSHMRGVKRVTISVDCANKATTRSNPSCIQVWIEDMHKRHYLAQNIVEKLEYIDLERKINDTARTWDASTIIVEDAGNGTTYIEKNRGYAPAAVVAIPTGNKSKEWRFDAVTPMIEGGEVWIPENKSEPWLEHYLDELLAFPNAPNDDQVDATSQYLEWARKKGHYGSRKLKGVNNTNKATRKKFTRSALLGR